MIVKVIVNLPSSNTDQYYDYIVPEEFTNFIKVGSRIKIPYGNSNREIMGFVMQIVKDSSYVGELKEITEVIDYIPVINDEQMLLASFIKEDAVCPLSTILNLMIPDAMRLKTKKYLTNIKYLDIDARLVEIFSGREIIEYTKELKKYDSIIAKEIEKENIKVTYEAKQVINDKYVNKYIINHDFTARNFKDLSLVKKNFLERISNEVPLTREELMEKYEINLYQVTSLYKKGFLDIVKEKISRIKIRTIPFNKRIRETDNKIVQNLIKKCQNYEKPILFIPEDENEKYEALIQLINFNQKNGKNTIIFVPEILSSYNIENFVRIKTGLSTALINSDLSSGELLDYYNEIRNDVYSVIITTSKGALYPYQNVGSFILLDSESDNYYNDQSPRYDLHKVFEKRADIINAKVIRMSFVPLVLEYTYALKGYLDIVENFKTKNEVNVEVVNLKEELHMGNNTTISNRLLKELKLTKAKNKKSILIVNNKGYSSYVMCRTCGSIMKCPKCKISLQYNKKSEKLICPACSYRIPYNNICPDCSSNELKFGGIGIEQVIEDLNELLPNFSVTELITNKFDTFVNVIESLNDDKLDIIVTTDVISRNVLADNIGLIGIVNIDTISKMADYDATFRAYSTLVYAGSRLNKEGKLLVQTYNPNDEYIKEYISGDYHTFIKTEVVSRKILKNEPFYYVNRILVKGKYEEMFKEANNIKQALMDHFKSLVFVIGPTYNYQYQAVQIIIKHKVNDISNFYTEIYEKYQSTTMMILIDKYPKYI